MVDKLNETYNNIKELLENARSKTYKTINSIMVETYWNIGKIIVEEEQNGKERADYGEYLIKRLSERLTEEYGKGFNIANMKNIRQFYLTFPKSYALRSQLSWTHYRLIMRVDNENARDFYIIESINNNWSTRELDRQINSLLYERLVLSKDKGKVKQLSIKGQEIQKPEDIIKDPFVLEFLNLDKDKEFHEKDLEKGLMNKLQYFLLELGKGFSFVSRQKRISVDNDNFYIDLVFYNHILKCFVLIDLKIGKLTHQDIGQMDFYVRYFEKEIKSKNDNPTIGLILCADKSKTMVKYTLLDDNKNIFASKYKTYLPSEEELKKEINDEKDRIERENKLNKVGGAEL